MTLRNLRISTNIQLHPEFSKDPMRFSRHNGIDLVADVFAETHLKKHPKEVHEKVETEKANIHLVQHGAIRLFTDRDGDADWVRSIELNPSLLLYDVKRHPLSNNDLLESLNALRAKVRPMLADPLDIHHIVPGLAGDIETVAYWSAIESELLLPRFLLPCFHDISHPSTGQAEGATDTRIQLGDKHDNCVIRFKKMRWESREQSGAQTIQGIRVKLILQGIALPAAFGRFGKTALLKDVKRLVSFPASAIARVHQLMMSKLEGTYLPVPSEWRDRTLGKPVTHAKTIALVSQLTSIPLEELRCMDEELRGPSKPTRTRLNRDVPAEAGRLMPVPVSTLFEAEVYSAREPGPTSQAIERIAPLIAAVYSQG